MNAKWVVAAIILTGKTSFAQTDFFQTNTPALLLPGKNFADQTALGFNLTNAAPLKNFEKSSPPKFPGIYQTEPFVLMVKVPEPTGDNCFFGRTNPLSMLAPMPDEKPDLRFVPKSFAQ